MHKGVCVFRILGWPVRLTAWPGAGRVARCAALAVVVALGVVCARAADNPAAVTMTDCAVDAAARCTDPGGDGSIDPATHRLIELREITIGKWQPNDPQADLFSGSYHSSGAFFRLELAVDGLVNPPGEVDPANFDPFRYGPHPVFGFVEIDMDNDVETGGELDAPQYRYLGNIVRFGGRPAIAGLASRVAEDASAFDGDFETAPFVERHGEEFHLALLGHQFGPGDIVVVAGDGDAVFEEGETWEIEAAWFHRAHGYEPFSLAQGGACDGEYAPSCALQFQHSVGEDITHISLVLPLTNVGAGLMTGDPPEPANADPTDQASIREGLIDLHDSAVFVYYNPTLLPEEALIQGWETKNPQLFLDPVAWAFTALLGTSYTVAEPSGPCFVWTDTYPDPVRGDVDGNGSADEQDRQLVQQYIAAMDSADGQTDGQVVVAAFAVDFSVFDVNHDGVVNGLDVLLVSVPGDCDGDGDVDLADFGELQSCVSGEAVPYTPLECGLADLDADGDVDGVDATRFLIGFNGPEEGS